VRGDGGWQVPLGPDWTLADWVARRGWPVVLVVGMRLGCLNHALLSAESIARRTRLLGWVANALPPRQARLEQNVADLERRMSVPLLARIGPGEVPGSRALCAILAHGQAHEGR
jgi:dethiobiotin synthetase